MLICCAKLGDERTLHAYANLWAITNACTHICGSSSLLDFTPNCISNWSARNMEMAILALIVPNREWAESKTGPQTWGSERSALAKGHDEVEKHVAAR